MHRPGLSKTGVTEMKRFEMGIVAAIVIYAIYLLGSQPLRQMVISTLTGLIVGMVLVGLLRVIQWLGRLFREEMPRTARAMGNGMFLLGVAIGVWMSGLVLHMFYTHEPLDLTAHVAGMGIYYFTLGFSARKILVPGCSPKPTR
jgi:predicted MFS family arabinose efflux permease